MNASTWASPREALHRALAEAERLAPLKAIAERWDEVEAKLNKRMEFGAEREDLKRQVESLNQSVSSYEDTIRSIEAQASQQVEERNRLDERIEAERRAYATRDEGELEARMDRLGRLTEHLVALERFADIWRQARADLADAARLHREAELEETEATKMEVAANGRRSRFQTVLDHFAEPLALAEAAVSKEAEKLRHQLVPGQPCPVCQSKEHPVHEDGRLAALAADLRTKVAGARAGIRDAEDEIHKARGEKASANARLIETQTSKERARMRCDDAAMAFEATRAEADPPWNGHGLGKRLPSAPAEFDESWSELLAAARTACASALRNARIARAFVDQLVKQRIELATDIERCASSLSEAERLLHMRGSDLRSAEERLTTANERISSTDREIGPWLEPARVTPDEIERDPKGTRIRLEQASAAWGTAQSALSEAAKRVRDLEPCIADAKANATSTADAASKALAAAEARRSALTGALSQRAALLGGEATHLHKGKMKDLRAIAAKKHQEAAAAANMAVATLAGAEQAVRSALNTHQQADMRLEEAERAVGEALEKTGIARQEAAELLAVPPDDKEVLRLHLDDLDQAVVAARAALKQRETDLSTALSAGEPDTPRCDLEIERSAIRERQRETQARIGAFANELQQDDEQRSQVAELDTQLAQASASARLLGGRSALRLGRGTAPNSPASPRASRLRR
jgi:exonuclease SbcC